MTALVPKPLNAHNARAVENCSTQKSIQLLILVIVELVLLVHLQRTQIRLVPHVTQTANLAHLMETISQLINVYAQIQCIKIYLQINVSHPLIVLLKTAILILSICNVSVST